MTLKKKTQKTKSKTWSSHTLPPCCYLDVLYKILLGKVQAQDASLGKQTEILWQEETQSVAASDNLRDFKIGWRHRSTRGFRVWLWNWRGWFHAGCLPLDSSFSTLELRGLRVWRVKLGWNLLSPRCTCTGVPQINSGDSSHFSDPEFIVSESETKAAWNWKIFWIGSALTGVCALTELTSQAYYLSWCAPWLGSPGAASFCGLELRIWDECSPKLRYIFHMKCTCWGWRPDWVPPPLVCALTGPHRWFQFQ